MTELKQVALSRIVERQNYRQEYDQAFVESLAADMSTNGYKLEYPMITYADGDQFVVIDGHTRDQAALLGSTYDLKSHKPIMLVWIVVKDKPTDAEFKLMQLSANEQRRDPDDISKAIGYQQAIDAGASIDDLMKATGHLRTYVEDRLSLLKLVPEARELVAKKHMGIKFACELTRLDTNFQRIAVQQYNGMKSPTLDEFRAVVNDLFTKMSQCTLLDLNLFNGKPIEQVMADLKIDRKPTRAELESQLAAERKARANDRQYAIKKFTQAQAEIKALRAQLAAQKAA